MPGVKPRRAAHEFGIAHCRRANDHPINAFAEPGLDRGEVAYSAAELNRHFYARKDGLDRVGIYRFAGEGPVEIDDVQIFKTLPRENLRLRGRIRVEDGRLFHVASHEAHACAALEIDRRNEDHGCHRRKLAISASPSFWLFSGWNWVPIMLSRPTIATIGPP